MQNCSLRGGFPGSSVGKESTFNAGDPHSWVRKIPWRRDRLPTSVFLAVPGGLDGKESTSNVRDLGLIPGLGRSPGGGNSNPLQYSCLKKKSHGQRSLAGYSPCGCQESDTNEHTHIGPGNTANKIRNTNKRAINSLDVFIPLASSPCLHPHPGFPVADRAGLAAEMLPL